MSESAAIDPSSRRSGGRAARVAARAAPLADNIRPVRAGMSGGTYNPLSQRDVERIHEAALAALELIGFGEAPQCTIDVLTRAGCTYGEDKRIRFPRALVEDMLKKAARGITLHGREERHDLLLEGSRVHFGTAGAAVYLVDSEKREYRETTVQDLYDAGRLVDQLDNIHFFQRSMVCRDIADNFEMDMNTMKAAT